MSLFDLKHLALLSLNKVPKLIYPFGLMGDIGGDTAEQGFSGDQCIHQSRPELDKRLDRVGK